MKRILIGSVNHVDTIFRSTDFNGDDIPDNIGFTILKIVRIEGDKYNPPYSSAPIDGRIYLEKISKHALLSLACLGVAFTAQPFLNKVIGLSYTAMLDMYEFIPSLGGICDRSNIFLGETYNTLVVTYILKEGVQAPQYLSDISLAHEIGHSFGSDHDIEPHCKGHLMSPHTINTINLKSTTFSECSKVQIVKVLETRGVCLKPDNRVYCGNGKLYIPSILDKNETDIE